MLKYNNQLLFPTLKKFPPDSHQSNLYQLDWNRVDNLKKERWLKTHQITSDQTFPGTLPKEFLSWTNEMVFSIPQGLLDEIRHCSLKAMEEWNRRKPEIKWEPIPSHTPVSSYVYKAFHLIADCLHDPLTNNFSRDQKKILIPYALAYRFWSFQIDPNKLQHYTGMVDLKECFQKRLDPFINLFYDFIGAIELHIISLMPSNEKASSKVIPNATLKDVIEGKRSSAYANATTITIPNLGNLNLSSIKFEKMYSPDFKITAEITNGNTIHLEDIKAASIPLAFKISDTSCQILIDSSEIICISSNPPPTITLKIFHYIWEGPDFTGVQSSPLHTPNKKIKIIKDLNDWQCGETSSVKKVDKNRIKKVRDEDLNALDDFKEIDMKPNFSADNSICLSPKNHK